MLDTPSKPDHRWNIKQPTPLSSTRKLFESINTESKSVLYDVAYNHYGRRIVTCSSDGTVRVWDYADEWVSNYELETAGVHKGVVTRASWSHPEYGQILATCSEFDNVATVWQERGGGLTTSTMSSSWDVKAKLSDAKLPISCLQFAPHFLGLKLATGSADGVIRIYEALDVRNYDHWTLQSSFHPDANRLEEVGVTCLSWCSSQSEPPTLVIGTSNGKVSFYRYNDSSRDWFMALSFPSDTKKGIADLSWAPKLARKFHTIASIDDDGMLSVFRVKPLKNDASPYTLCLEAKQVLDQGVDHDSTDQRRRCAWNATGTSLACSSDEDGVVQLWEESLSHEWKCVSKVFDN